MAIHEAGHAIVALHLGKDVLEVRIDVPEGDDTLPMGGGYSLNYAHRESRSWHACSCLAGVLACAMYARDFAELDQWNNWGHCHEDMRLFNAARGGMSYRQARRITLDILRERKDDLLDLAAILIRDGFVDHTNAPAKFTEKPERIL